MDVPVTQLDLIQKYSSEEGKTATLSRLGGTGWGKTKDKAKRAIKDFESLRNNLAHAQDIVTYDWAQIARLAQRMEGYVSET